MRQYELTMVFRTKLEGKERTKLLETIKSWMPDAKVTKEEEWEQKPLSYPIKKEVAGYYVMLQLEAESMSADVERRLLLNDEILRHLLIRAK